MAKFPPFGPGRAPRDLTYDFAPGPRQGSNSPFDLVPQAPFRKFQGFLALATVLGTVLGSGASLRLVAPNPVARSCGLAGPPHAGDVPVQAPGPGRPQHLALAGAQGALKLVQCRGGTHRINTQFIKYTSTWHARHQVLCASTNRYRSIYPTIV